MERKKKPPRIKISKSVLNKTHLGLHCLYWGHATLNEISFMTPVYATLFGISVYYAWTAKDDGTHEH